MALIQRGFLTGDGNHAPAHVKNGNFELNKDSLQAQGLSHFFPCSPLQNWRSIWRAPQGSVGGTPSPAPTQFGHRAWEGGSRHIDTEFTPAAGTTQLGVICWVQGLSNGSARDVVGSVDAGTDSAALLILNPGGNSGRFNFFIRDDGATFMAPNLNDASLFDGGPHLVAGYLDGTTAKSYLDGASNSASDTGGGFGGLALAQSFFIGARNNDGSRANAMVAGELVWMARFYENIGVGAFERIVDAAFNPSTRWDLVRETGRVSYFFVPAAAGGVANPHNPLGHPLIGPFGGPI